MKGSRSQSNRQNKDMPVSHRPQPQNKDDLDSRSGEEQETKGDDITHNEREHQNDRKKVKNK